ncbi:MAG: hypothetical protein H6835_11810 [Planctomycetes bacterium]|nr:hypothetical protein [Planctomycetota bacterium]
MSKPAPPTREEVAMVELGQTTVGRPTAIAAVVLLLLTIVVVPLLQLVHELRAGNVPHVVNVFTSAPSERNFHEFERTLEDESQLGQLLLPPVQALLSRVGCGNEQAYLAPDGWLFYRPGFDYVTGRGFLEPEVLKRRRLGGRSWEQPPQPDPLPAILQFRDQLRARGVELVLMPTTVKAQLDPTGTVARDALPLQNPSWPRLAGDLQEHGVRVFDPTQLLAAQPEPFLKTDTHWTAAAMRAVAQQLAKTLQPLLPDAPDAGYRSEARDVEHLGDIAIMLRLPDDQTQFAPEHQRVEAVLQADGTPWQPSTTADVLLLGDSFSNIYSLPSMGFGEGAGLVESLSLAMQRPVDRITINDAGAAQTRRSLRDELRAGRDRLAGKRVVVWQFAMREFAVGDWQLLELPTVTTPAATRSAVSVRAKVASLVLPPQPGTVPYKDCLIGVALRDVEVLDGRWPEGAATDKVLVYTPGMIDNAWTAITDLRAGALVEWQLVPWEAAPDAQRSLNRRELDDEDLLLADPWFHALR